MEHISFVKYEVLSLLGQGGMGQVYKVRHRELDTVYAIKILQPQFTDQPELVRRFHNEARIMAQLRHPHIVRVYDFEREGTRHYFVMEYIEGLSLQQILAERGALPPAECVAIAQQIAQALAHAHPQTIHRDIKPSNILIERDSRRVVVTDFGIAKVLDSQDTRITNTGLMLGTLRYASPEQLRGDAKVDGRSDLFSLGMVIFEMLIGGTTHANAELPVTVPAPLRHIVERCIQQDPAARFPDAETLQLDLQHGAASSTKRGRTAPRGSWVVALVTTVVVAVLLVWKGYPLSSTAHYML
jgi:serine/threonine-protein kinase